MPRDGQDCKKRTRAVAEEVTPVIYLITTLIKRIKQRRQKQD
jgi:hypothetical protein